MVARLSLASAVLAAAALAVSGWGMYAALGLGLWGAGTGVVAARSRGASGGARLMGAGAAALAGTACLLGAAKIVLTLAAISELTSLAS